MAYSLDDLIDDVLIETGQYIADLDATLLSNDRFARMAARELGNLSRYKPRVVTSAGTLYQNKVFQPETDLHDVPETITEIRRIGGQANLFIGGSKWGIIPGMYWRYDKPVLNFSLAEEQFQYTYTVFYKYDETTKTYPYLDENSAHRSLFIRLVAARFLISVGRSRRAFTIDDIPVRNDSSDMVSEGQEAHKDTMDEIRQRSGWHLAITP